MNVLNWLKGISTPKYRRFFTVVFSRNAPRPLLSDAKHEYVLIIVNNTSGSAASLLAWNIAVKIREQSKTIVIVFNKGDMVPTFKKFADVTFAPPFSNSTSKPLSILEHIIERFRVRYAVAIGVETTQYAQDVERCGIPTVLLINELTRDIEPGLVSSQIIFNDISRIVFPSEAIRASYLRAFDVMSRRKTYALPYGAFANPPSSIGSKFKYLLGTLEDLRISRLMNVADFENEFLIVGAGKLGDEESLDLFVAITEAARKRIPAHRLHVLWVKAAPCTGMPSSSATYQKFKARILSLLGEEVYTLRDVRQIENIYAKGCSMAALSLQPDICEDIFKHLALVGIPIVCLGVANELAACLTSSQVTRPLVINNLDQSSAGEAVSHIATDPTLFKNLSAETKKLATSAFDMRKFVEALDKFGEASAIDKEAGATDRRIIEKASDFDADFYCGRKLHPSEREYALTLYMASTRNFHERNCFTPFQYTQRPFPGFNPYRFLHEKPIDQNPYRDPLAEYIRSGRSVGPWLRQIFGAPRDTSADRCDLRVAVHGHFHYPELFNEFLSRLMLNKTRYDLLITTNTNAAKNEIEGRAKLRGQPAQVLVVPNRGRNIGPFITSIGPMILSRYDVVAHIHGKRSLEHQPDDGAGDRWRTFLWEHLIGGNNAMLDHLISVFARERDIGLIYPEDRDLPGWDTNKDIAERLACDVGVSTPLPSIIDFPVGNMFLARVDALKSLFNSGLRYEDYPHEPVAYDGTILHALERLLPLAVESLGFRSAAVHLPYIFR